MVTQKITRLPSLPTIAVEILRVFSDPDIPVSDVVKLVQADPAIAGKLLKAANSSRFGLAREVGELRQAITLLGKAKVTPIVLSFSLAADSIEDPEHAAAFQMTWLRSFVRATAGEALGAAFDPGCAAESFTINLLAGIGQLGLLKQDANAYLECLAKVKDGQQTLDEAEQEAFGTTSLQITLKMMENSSLPQRCIAAVAALAPQAEIADADAATVRQQKITVTADALARYFCDHDSGIARIALEEHLADLDAVKITADALTETVKQRIDESASLFDINPNQLPDPDDLLADAMEQLAEFTQNLDANVEVPDQLMAENGRLKIEVENLVRQTSTDALTGVANRAAFDRQLRTQCLRCLSRGRAFGICVIDIDHFKSVNDTYGHQAGDYILKQVAQNLNRVTRAHETLARYGGEEFAVLLEEVEPSGMNILGERLRSTVENLHIEFGETVIPVTISIGIACGTPQDEDGGKTLFADADAALYESKKSGRNCVTIRFAEQESEKNTSARQPVGALSESR